MKEVEKRIERDGGIEIREHFANNSIVNDRGRDKPFSCNQRNGQKVLRKSKILFLKYVG